MKKHALLTIITFLWCGLLFAQQIITDFESGLPGETGTNGQMDYTPGAAEFSVVDNPDKSGINTSDKVGKFTRKKDGNWWAYAWFQFPATEVEATRSAPKYLHVKVYKSVISPVCTQMKDRHNEPDVDTGEIVNKKQTKTNEWQDLVFKITTSGTYSYFEFKPDFLSEDVGGRLNSDIEIYFDDIIINDDPTGVGEEPEPVIPFEGNMPENFEGQKTLLDPGFYGEQYGTFGNNEDDPAYLSVTENPYQDGTNPTAKCAKFIRRVTGEWWAGVWMVPKDPMVIDAENRYLHVMIYKTMESPVVAKLEGNGISTGDITALNSGDGMDEWIDYVFEFPEELYNTYEKINLMPDFVVEVQPDDRFIRDQIIYFDEMVINNDATPRMTINSISSENADNNKMWLDADNNLHVTGTYNGAIRIYSILGTLERNYPIQNSIINLSDLPKGVYFIQSDSSKYSTKIIIR